MRIRVRVKPKAKKEEVKKISEEEYEVKVKEPPEGGRANERLIELLSKYFKVPKSSIRIVSGHTSRNKVVEIG